MKLFDVETEMSYHLHRAPLNRFVLYVQQRRAKGVSRRALQRSNLCINAKGPLYVLLME